MEKTCQDQSGNAVSVSAQLVQPAPPVQPAHTTGTPIEIPSKRTIADRTPPYVPTNVKKTITKPTTRSQMVKSKNLNVSTSDFKLSLDKPVDFSFSQNDPASKPFFTREVNPPLALCETQILDLSSQSGIPDWFIVYQKQQQDQTRFLNQRLNALEEVMAENKRLRTDLDLAQQRIAELEAQVSTEAIPTLVLDPKVTQGTEASKYATPNASLTSTSQPLSFAAVATKGKDAPAPKSKAPARRRKTTARQMEAIHRRFVPVAAHHDYEYVYLPSRYREPISSLRSKLHKLKINNARVLDVHYPDRQVVALLVHTEYTADLLAAFAKAKVEPIQGFNPLNPDLLRDPKYANLSESDRAAKCTEVHQARLVRALKHIRESVRPAVARSFFVKDWITLDQYKEVIPTVTRAARAAESTQDATMEDIHNTFSTTELDPLDAGESTSSQ
ncbi:hypothetical protein RO3G_04119 [Rhizopus delemar RA 99-880]|uniref:Uncharacterized protein n=1 Tax=Rhizopus delemar (strain RA 99-880 / ATCC MYA-4621 / FGSC 9543 / NRRL 43880) TaxID=246409 RepID=I1BT84_RHIO9|nr:hypothetical protein RO3G_04119 [Rhizopus delemar RA 99-880]|eukprot:EIE79414.1 hypothetical protein RO3G_04119 [Rhizopus delemar RA 99-880]